MQSINLCDKNFVLKKLGISSATLDNWIRLSLPHALIDGQYDLDSIQDFVKETKKLQSRAHKKKSSKIEYPKELVKYLDNSDWVKEYICFIDGKDKTVLADKIVELYKNRLMISGVLSYDSVQTEQIYTGSKENSDRVNAVSKDNSDILSVLSSIIPHEDFYSYSVAYQILLDSGQKNTLGAYYTPKSLVQEIVNSLVSKDKKFLEPCCGVGFYTIEYILAYKKKFNCFPDGLMYSNDIDPISSEITRLNIINITKGEFSNFVITCGDGLKLPYDDMDLVVTNPPYGIKYVYSDMKTTEIFSHFIHKSLSKYLSENGVMNFILPDSVLAVDKHKEIREYFLKNHTVEKIKYFGKSFDGVFSDVISLQILKKNPENNVIKMLDKQSEEGVFKEISQNIFLKNGFKIIQMDEKESVVLEQYYSIPHQTLKEEKFSLGIVTGNNTDFVFSEIPLQKYREIISGKEISKGQIQYDGKKYILDCPSKYQQKPDMSLFLKKKIVYKFISKDIVSAVDTSGILTLNSANFIILNNGLQEEYVSALLNSRVLNFIYKMKFGNPLKVLKKNIQELPIFVFSEEIQSQIIENYKQGRHSCNDDLIEETVQNYISQGSFS